MNYFCNMKDKLESRYLPPDLLEQLLREAHCFDALEILGHSVENRPIYGLKLGNGAKKILAWSQMHGNETTATKACLDLLSYLRKEKEGQALLNELQLLFIFQLNPDGALRYTRLNANKVDLNRDAVVASQPEMKVLKKVFLDFKPNLCLNLHGQRTIFAAGNTSLPASLSFLAPAAEETRAITPARLTSMQLIAKIAYDLPHGSNWGIGRYDDTFNINCTGDYFTAQNTPTLLFEAGHFPEDYTRAKTRELFFMALLSCLNSFNTSTFSDFDAEDYQRIPGNQSHLRDIQLKNVTIVNNGITTKKSLFVQFKEVLKHDKVHFIPEYAGMEEGLIGLQEIDAEKINQTAPVDIVKSATKITKHLQSFIDFPLICFIFAMY